MYSRLGLKTRDDVGLGGTSGLQKIVSAKAVAIRSVRRDSASFCCGSAVSKFWEVAIISNGVMLQMATPGENGQSVICPSMPVVIPACERPNVPSNRKATSPKARANLAMLLRAIMRTSIAYLVQKHSRTALPIPLLQSTPAKNECGGAGQALHCIPEFAFPSKKSSPPKIFGF